MNVCEDDTNIITPNKRQNKQKNSDTNNYIYEVFVCNNTPH